MESPDRTAEAEHSDAAWRGRVTRVRARKEETKLRTRQITHDEPEVVRARHAASNPGECVAWPRPKRAPYARRNLIGRGFTTTKSCQP